MASSPKRLWPILAVIALGGNLVLALLLALGSSDEKTDAGVPEVETYPLSWDDQRDLKFIHNSAFKLTMRQMWMNANTIVSSGSGDQVPAYDEIAISAKGIARKAREMATYWQGVLDAANVGAEAAPDEDWFGLAQAHTDIWKSCNHCHRETWSMAYSHVDESIVETWKKGKLARLRSNQMDDAPPPKIANRDVMQGLSAAAVGLESAIEKRNTKDAQASLATIIEVAKMRLNLWNSLRTEAAAIEAMADAHVSESMQMAYRKMTGACFACHAAIVGEDRAILAPLVWR